MNTRDYFTEDGKILNLKGKEVNVSKFAEDFLTESSIEDIRYKGSFFELTRTELDEHYDRIVFEV